MENAIQSFFISLIIVMGGGWALSALHFQQWFALGLPIAIAFAVGAYMHRQKPLTWKQRHGEEPIPSNR